MLCDVWADNGDSLTTPPRPTTHPVSSERFHPLFNWTICEANLSDDHFCCFLLSAIPGSLIGGFQSEMLTIGFSLSVLVWGFQKDNLSDGVKLRCVP